MIIPNFNPETKIIWTNDVIMGMESVRNPSQGQLIIYSGSTEEKLERLMSLRTYSSASSMEVNIWSDNP